LRRQELEADPHIRSVREVIADVLKVKPPEKPKKATNKDGSSVSNDENDSGYAASFYFLFVQ